VQYQASGGNAYNNDMSKHHILTGFHAIRTRIKLAPESVKEVLVDKDRRDARMRDMITVCKGANIEIIQAELSRLDKLCAPGTRHQGVVALADEMPQLLTVADVLDQCAELGVEPFLLVLDGITDPRNLGACLRVADGAGIHAVIAPKDRAAPLNDIAQQTAAGAAQSVPYVLVTNLARALDELVEAGVTVVGLADEADSDLYQSTLTGPLALVMGAEGDGMRRLTRERCDTLVSIPMGGAVESLNVSVATGVVLYEAVRQRRAIVPR
jgi:23S rRNA (guanosine2251-2'-O)-methyltransferase